MSYVARLALNQYTASDEKMGGRYHCNIPHNDHDLSLSLPMCNAIDTSGN